MKGFEELDIVRLSIDIDLSVSGDYHVIEADGIDKIKKGNTGTIVYINSPDSFDVEFYGKNVYKGALITLPKKYLLPLKGERL